MAEKHTEQAGERTHSDWAVEIVSKDGPTGTFREVLEISVMDFGGNELWKGLPGEQPEFRIPVELVATKTGGVVHFADHLCDC